VIGTWIPRGGLVSRVADRDCPRCPNQTKDDVTHGRTSDGNRKPGRTFLCICTPKETYGIARHRRQDGFSADGTSDGTRTGTSSRRRQNCSVAWRKTLARAEGQFGGDVEATEQEFYEAMTAPRVPSELANAHERRDGMGNSPPASSCPSKTRWSRSSPRSNRPRSSTRAAARVGSRSRISGPSGTSSRRRAAWRRDR